MDTEKGLGEHNRYGKKMYVSGNRSGQSIYIEMNGRKGMNAIWEVLLNIL